MQLKHRRFVVITIMLAFVMTSILLPGLANADQAGSSTVNYSATGNLSGEKQEQSKVAGTFSDINNHPCEAAIRDLQAVGLASGFPDGTFRPDAPVTQMEAIALIIRLADIGDESTNNPEKLENVPAWAQPAVQKAIQRGIISVDDFPNAAPATRTRIMVWLAKAVGLEEEEAGSLPFKDRGLIPAADAGYIRALLDKAIITGTPDGNLEPNGIMTRAQLAVILKNTLDQNLGISLNRSNKDLVSLDILSVTDFHGALLEDNNNPGAAKLGKWLKNEKAQNPEGTLILSAGDMSQGSFDSNLLYGKTVIQAMNEIGFDAMTVGNHEFDWGLDCLKTQAVWAGFPILTANITDKKTGQSLEGTKPWVIVEKKGVKIGIIGVTTEETNYDVIPKVISLCKIDNPAQIVNRLVPELKQQGAQVIIVLGHLGGYLDNETNTITGEVTELANAITGVDVLVAGHTHQKIAAYINGIPVIEAYCNGRAVGHIALKYSLTSQKIISAIPSVIDLPTPDLIDDIQVKAIIDEGQKELGPVKNEIIGENATELSHQRDKFSLLGQWVTDVMRRETNADIAFQHGGGLRTGIPAGAVTVGRLWEIMPFDNTLILLDMKGSQVMHVLQYGIYNPKHGSLQYSGIKVKYDPLLPQDKRIVEVTLPDGSGLDPDKTYRVVTNDFIAAGGDEYTMFKEGSNITDTHLLARDVLIDYIRKIKNIDFKGDDRLMNNEIGYKQESGILCGASQTALAGAA